MIGINSMMICIGIYMIGINSTMICIDIYMIGIDNMFGYVFAHVH